MRIRTQLILAAFVLAVVPLAAIVTWSYYSSRNALEAAYRREADQLTRQMDRRLASIRAELDQRLTFVSSLPAGDMSNIVTVMGETASFVDALEFQPVQTPPRAAEPERAALAEPDPETKPEEKVTEVAEAPPPPAQPIVIDLPPAPQIPRFVMSEEQRELLAEIRKLSVRISQPNLEEGEREDLAKELEATQKELEAVVGEDRRRYEAQMEDVRMAARAYRAAQRRGGGRGQGAGAGVGAAPPPTPAPAPAPTPAVALAPAVAATPKVRPVTPADVAKNKKTTRATSLILGRKFAAPVRKEGEVVGQITARISPEQVLSRVLSTNDDGREIPFALDREGTLYARTPQQKATLERLGVADRLRGGQSLRGIPGWIVTASRDEQSGLRIGVARPVGENLDELRRTAGRNFALGLGLIAFALIGIVPLSNHLTRDVKLVTDGAERIAHGDLMTRLPVKTKNELGQLARAFNQMAEDLSLHQQRLLEQERARKEQELQQKLLSVEYERKSVELEDARRFQLSMLPKEVPHHEGYDVAVFTRTATEVGGDYYDFHLLGDVLSVTIGDATGHGAKAGTMVTVVKTLFAAYTGAVAPASFLGDAAETIKRMELGRMSMALSVGRFDERRLTLASAGMPPVLVHRAATGSVDEIALGATPLGTLGTDYPETTVDLAAGDTILFLTDGFPELMNNAGQQLGYAAATQAFAAAARAGSAAAVIDGLGEAARKWHGDAPPNDDVTFVVVRVA